MHGSVLTYTCSDKLLTDDGFLKCSECGNILRDQRSQALNDGFWRVHAEISPDSLNLLMILWNVDDEIPQFLAIVHREMFLNCKTICSHSCSQSGEPRPSLLVNNRCFLSIPQLSQCFVAPIPAVSEHVAGIQFKMRVCLHKNNNVLSV